MAKHTTKQKDEKEKIIKKREEHGKEVASTGGVQLIRKPRKFSSVDELLSFFNLYLASCQIKKQKKTKTYGTYIVEEENEILENYKKTGKDIPSNGLVFEHKIEEERERKTFPTKAGRYVFMGTSRQTRSDYRKNQDYSDTIEIIDYFFESLLESEALKGEINPRIAEFLLNTVYGRIPGKKVENKGEVKLSLIGIAKKAKEQREVIEVIEEKEKLENKEKVKK